MNEIKPPPPNGSLMLAWQVKNKHVLVVGAGEVALSRVNHLLQADSRVTVIGKEIDPTLKKYNEMGLLEKVEEREFEMKDLIMYEPDNIRETIKNLDFNSSRDCEIIEKFDKEQKFSMILTCINDYDLSLKIWYKSKQLGLNVNLADKPKSCDFFFGSVYRQGPLQIMISTNGNSPRLCNRIKNKLLIPMFDSLDLENAIKNLGYLRGQLRNVYHPGEETQTIKERMEWNKKITDFYSIKEWCTIKKEDIDKILKLYPNLPRVDSLNDNS